MIDFLKRLFGGGDSPRTPASTDATGTPGSGRAEPQGAPHSEPRPEFRARGGKAKRVVDHYFELSAAIERGKADRDYRSAIAAARVTYPIMAEVVRAWTREYGSFDIQTSHAVHTAPRLMAVLEDREGIRELREVLESVRELGDWLPEAEQAECDIDLVVRIMAAVHQEPGLAQSRLKEHLATTDGHRIAQLAGLLEKASRIRRVKKGASYALYPAGHPVGAAPGSTRREAAALPVSPVIDSNGEAGSSTATLGLSLRSRSRRSPTSAREIDLEVLPYIRLPKAPARWEERQGQQAEGQSEHEPARKDVPRFVAEGAGWRIIAEEKLRPEERPDPAYKDAFPTGGSTFWLDPKGHREGFEDAASVLRVTDRTGSLVAERGLGHDVYRSDVNTDGSAILFMSREGVLHAYSDRLEPILAERVEDLPEYRAQAERLGIERRELRNHVRSVAISADRSRHLVTVVDEAWCLSTTSGDVLWGARLPQQEGWTKVVTPRMERSGTSGEVEAALRLMELELPVAPEDITRQYRRLAMRWHPDRNPQDTGATQQFQELVAAMELLTGADLRGIDSGEVERMTYQKILRRERIAVPVREPGTLQGIEVTISLGASEKQAADWIYAANFGSSDNRVFLAGYSGRVVEVSDNGIPTRAYDLGAVPRHIIETTSHLYMLTDTRLYVLSGDRLEALVDVFDQGDLIAGDTGFGLLESKVFSWLSPSGRRLGGVRTRDPIRRVLSVPEGLVVETRRHRATVRGAASWWQE